MAPLRSSALPIAIVRWFLDSKGLVLFATGPVVQMTQQEFREAGFDWVRRHFHEYSKTRLPRDKFIKVFEPGEAKKYMGGRRVLQVHVDPDNNLILSPMIVGKYDLGDLKRVKPLAEQTIPISSSSGVFWTTFDKALAAAPLDE